MKKDGYYSSGEFAKMARITKKTIRYYHEHNILEPSFITEKGARFYTDEDFARLQQILLLKNLGFSLDEIREMTIHNSDKKFLSNSLHMQLKLIQDQMDQLQVIASTIQDVVGAVDQDQEIDWSQMLNLIHMMGMEQSLKKQYQNVSNISARIELHSQYSVNQQGWFPWIYEQCKISSGMKVLELGCGDASLWRQNRRQLPENIQVTLSDISEGMIRDIKHSFGEQDSRFTFKVMDCHDIQECDETYDLVIANHVLFYCENLSQVCKEIARVLKKGGRLVCSSYGSEHMSEISKLVEEFDDRIVLSADKLYEKFGRENGEDILGSYFSECRWLTYEDSLHVTEAEPLISYILSCHGNQNQYIIDRYKDFKIFVRSKLQPDFQITKDAGMFICRK